MPARLDAKDVRSDLGSRFDSHVEKWRPVLIEQVSQVQVARTPQDFATIHMDLLERFAARQDVAAQRRDDVDDLKRRRAELIEQTPKPILAIRKLSSDIETRE